MPDTANNATVASHVTRILILSYFVALGLGLIEGAELTRLTAPFLEEPQASYAIGIVVVLLAFMVLTGMFRRPAALILSLILFWASYMSMFATDDLTGFWRDLALIGGLLMTAGVGEGWVMVRRVASDSDDEAVEERIVSKPLPDPGMPKPRTTITRFREDLHLAREA